MIRASRAEVEALKEEEEEEEEEEKESVAYEDEDVHMSDQADIAPKQARKKKVKKVIPVGRNGLKKKRIVKSRMKMDEKGYMGLCLAHPCAYSSNPPRSHRGLFRVRIDR